MFHLYIIYFIHVFTIGLLWFKFLRSLITYENLNCVIIIIITIIIIIISLSNLEIKTDTYFALWEESQFSTSVVHIDLSWLIYS